MKRYRVLIADDQEFFRELSQAVLQRDYEVVGAVGDGCALLAAAGQLEPDLVLSDISMPELDGISAIRELRSLLPGVKVVLLTGEEDPETVVRALQAGADGYLPKRADVTEIRRAVEQVLAGLVYVSRLLAPPVIVPLSSLVNAPSAVAEIAGGSHRS